MFSSKILFLVLPRSQEATHTWPACLAVFWCDFRLWYVKHKIWPRKSWTEVTRMKRGERGPEKEGRKTTFSPRNHQLPPPPASPPWPRFSFRTVYFLPYETQAKNTPEKNRLRRLTHTTNLIRVRVGFFWVWLLLRRTFFLFFFETKENFLCLFFFLFYFSNTFLSCFQLYLCG